MRGAFILCLVSIVLWAGEPSKKASTPVTEQVKISDVSKPEGRTDEVQAIRTLDSLNEDTRRERTGVSRVLASGTPDEDVSFYKSLTRRLGVDVGVMFPSGDFAKEFSSSPLIGMHFMWEAIRPLNLAVSTYHSSAPRLTGPDKGRLSVSSIAVGTNASWEIGRTVSYARLEACFDFNDLSLGATYISSGGDSTVTTLGLNFGLGIDFIVGREVSFGLQAFYHYSVPKKVTLSDGTQFDLGSPYAVGGLRINF